MRSIRRADEVFALCTDTSGAAMVEYVIALTVATMIAVGALWQVGKPMLEHFFWSYGLMVQPT